MAMCCFLSVNVLRVGNAHQMETERERATAIDEVPAVAREREREREISLKKRAASDRKRRRKKKKMHVLAVHRPIHGSAPSTTACFCPVLATLTQRKHVYYSGNRTT